MRFIFHNTLFIENHLLQHLCILISRTCTTKMNTSFVWKLSPKPKILTVLRHCSIDLKQTSFNLQWFTSSKLFTKIKVHQSILKFTLNYDILSCYNRVDVGEGDKAKLDLEFLSRLYSSWILRIQGQTLFVRKKAGNLNEIRIIGFLMSQDLGIQQRGITKTQVAILGL